MGATFETRCHAVQKVVELDVVAPDREDSVVDSRKEQEVCGELREPVGFVCDRAQRRFQLVLVA